MIKKETKMDLSSVIGDVGKAITVFGKFNKTLDKTTKSADEAGNSLGKIASAANIVSLKTLTKGVTRLMQSFSKYSQKAVDYIEDLNLLKVAFGDTAEQAKRLVENISAVTGFDEATLTRNLGTFRNLTSTLGATNEVADLLAKNLEKMSIDISSLYNVDLDRAAYALTGMLTGQPRTIKTLTGANITQNALQEDLTAMGINRTVRELNKAEKAILSYISLEKQLMQSNGDMARTIEQPAQLLRVFREQLSKAARSIGTLLIPAIKAVIPYLTAFLMAFNEIVGAIATFFGWDADTFWADMTSGAKATAEGIGAVSKAADKAQRGLRNFDKLNVINSPSSSGGSGGSGGLGNLGIDNRLLAALKDYNLHLESIQTKAIKIKNQIMKLLGFHEELNEETGKWEWKYDGIGTTIKNLRKAFSNLNPKVKTFAVIITGLVAASTIKKLGQLVSLFGNTGLGKWIGKLLTPTALLAENIFSIISGKATIGLKDTVNMWSNMLTPIQKIGTALVGGGMVYSGLQLTRDGIRKIAEESNKTFGIIESGAGLVSSVIGGGLAGASVGGATGGLIGGIIGGIGFIIQAIDEADTSLNTNIHDIERTKEEVDKLYSDWKQSVDELNEAYKKANVESDYYQRLWDELQGITDENGKIKKGYEDRAEVISTILSDALGVEIQVVNGNIKKWKELQGEIDNYILKRKNAIKLSTLENAATEAINKKAEAEKNLLEAYGVRIEAEEKLKDKISGMRTEYSYATEDIYDYIMGLKTADELAEKYDTTVYAVNIAMSDFVTRTQKQKKALDTAIDSYNDASKTLNGYNQTIKNYETALGLSLQNNQVALDKFFDHEQFLYGKSYDEQEEYWEQRKKLNELGLKNLEETRNNYSKKEYEGLQNSYKEEQKLIETEMDKLKLIINTKNGEISDDMVNQWAAMGKNSENEFIANISDLPNDIKKELYDKLKEKGVELTDAMQEALDNNKPKMEIEIGAKEGKNISTAITGITNKLKQSLSSILGNNFNINTITPKAEGGFVDSGEIYLARENGMSEFVGRVGHKTAVANNDQIVDAVAQGVANAIVSTGGLNNKPVIIKAEGDANGLMNFIKLKQQEDDMQYGY